MSFKYILGLFSLTLVLGFTPRASKVEAVSTHQSPASQAPGPGVVGRWVSQGCETRAAGGGNKLYVKRDTTIGEASSAFILMVYAEAKCQTPNLTLRFEGP